jgi:hypothetical protein
MIPQITKCVKLAILLCQFGAERLAKVNKIFSASSRGVTAEDRDPPENRIAVNQPV